MNLNDIIERFTLVSGLSMNETSRYLPMLTDCIEWFGEHIPGELSPAQQRRAVHACAVYAYYRVCILLRDSGIGSFKAGDVQITAGNAAERCAAAERMWSEERSAIADIADFDGGFAFRSVCV